ncbi:hypothetical protein BDB00DRAFT_762981 [Zychaea mexicana]|uniref:uncharacterized protein n=1 Tax=Zychaea mexicana TaxID=64656 RepID=UPI0022FEC566|nr:uncharacterized protein BDB00DRAFT_762981 [Zychaea mexicana]KAI9493755.1 hypothetical protein BDB00DRAFT_762981 [Zychaea mexicana]
MLAGRNKRVRCYSYDALLRLCHAIYNIDWTSRNDTNYDVPSMSEWKRVASQSGKAPEDEVEEDSWPDNDVEQQKQQQQQQQQQPTRLVLTSGLALKQHYVCNDVVLQEFYYKFPDCKDVLRLQTYQTSAYVFAAVLQRDKIVVWQQRRRDQQQSSSSSNDCKWRLSPFYKFKVYWIPAEPRWISFADDRITLRYLLAIFSTEATAIGLRNSKVRTVPIDPKLAELYQKTWLREQSRSHSSPHPPPSPSDNTASSSALPPSSSFPTLPTTTTPDIQWSSLIQLPFYPNPLTTSLTSDYSNPPSYDAVVTSSPSEAVDPVALSSTMSPQLFFATLCRQSYIIDLIGGLFSTLVYHWTHEPQHIEFIQLAEDDWCAVGFGRESVELLHMRTGERIHRIMNSVPVCFLGRWDIKEAGKKKVKALFWCCATPQDNAHIYMLQGNNSPHTTAPSTSNTSSTTTDVPSYTA